MVYKIKKISDLESIKSDVTEATILCKQRITIRAGELF